MSRIYEHLCKKINDRLGVSREELKEKEEEKRDEYIKKARELRKAEGELREAQIIHGEDSKSYKKAKKNFEKAESKYEEAERNYKRTNFKKTMYFTDMDLEYDEVILFSVVMAIVAFSITLVALLVIQIYAPLDLFQIFTYALPSLIVIPMAVLIFTANYPEILEKRLKAETIGKAPEGINYMTMSMRVTPSLYRAISFAAKNTEEPMASGFNKVLWDVYTRKKSSIEESFLSFALDWGKWNEDLKRSLYAIRSAMLEKTKHGFNASLEKANEIIISGTKRQIEDFTNSLSTPTTILFAIGILLPLIIGAMLPMLALSGLDIGSITSDTAPEEGGMGILHIILLMDVLAPAGALVYSYKILGSRPGTISPPDIPLKENKRNIILYSAMITIFTALMVIFLSDFLRVFYPLQYFWPPVIGISYYCIKTSWGQNRERERMLKMEREFPDALFQLGSRIAEGMSPERAIQETGKSMEGTEIGGLMNKITCTLQVNRLPLNDALFGEEGVLEKLPSNTIKATFKTVVEVSQKEPKEAGKTIVQISDYLRSMEEMDHDIKSRLSQSVEMMKGTVLVFAPIVMGVVSSLYFMLHDIFSEISNMKMITPTSFAAVVGVYLILLSFVITYFTTGIKYKSDPIEFKYNLGFSLPVSIGVFTFTVVLGKVGLLGI